MKARRGSGRGIWRSSRRAPTTIPSIIQGRDGTIHAVYSYFVDGGKSMKHAAFNEAWVQAGDESRCQASGVRMSGMIRRRNYEAKVHNRCCECD